MSFHTTPRNEQLYWPDQAPKPPSVPSPGYFKAKREGKPLPVTDWTRIFREGQVARFDGHVELLYKSTGKKTIIPKVGEFLYYDHGVNYSLNHPSDSVMLTEARGKANTMGWDVATFAVEAEKTYALVRHAHSRTLNRVDNILRAKRRTIKTLEEFASAWLENRYGWRLLGYDLESAQLAVDRFSSSKFYDRFTVGDELIAAPVLVENTGATNQFPYICKGTYHYGYQTAVYNSVLQMGGSYKVYRDVRSVKRAGVGVEVDRFLGSASTNLVLTGWEVVPYSFIIDWFVNVGSFLAAVTPTLGRTPKWEWVSLREEVDYRTVMTVKSRSETSSYRWTCNVMPTNGLTRRTKYERRAMELGTVPSVLAVQPSLSLPKFADLAALAFGHSAPYLRR